MVNIGKVRVVAVTVFAGAISLLAAQPNLATERLSEFEQALGEEEPAQDIWQFNALALSQLNTIQRTDTAVDQRLVQIAQAAVPITGVQLNSTEQGVQVTLETTSELAAPQTSVVGNAFIADIPNAVLALPENDRFSAAEPAAGIALVNVTNLPNNRVRVAVTGTDAPPAVEISTRASGLVLAVTAGTSNTGDAEDDSIQIVVAGEGSDDNYAVPNATTATRTDTPILDIPQSIQVIPRQVLEDQQVIDLDEALSNVSGVSEGRSFAGVDYEYNIRGFANAPVLRDGFRRYASFEGDPETSNLERVEILRGPSSILYGEIQPGGVINLVSEQPLSEPFYQLEVQGGNRGLFRPQMDVSGPLTPDRSLLYRLNMSYFHDDGFRNYDQDVERFFVAPVVSWQIGDRTDVSFQLEYANEQRPVEVGLPAIGDGIADIPFERITNEPDQLVDSEFLNLGYNLEHRFSDDWRLRNAFRYSNRQFFNDASPPLNFLNDDENTGIIERYQSRQDIFTEDYSLQTNVVGEFATGPIDHTLLVGVDLNRSEEDEFTRFDFTAQPLNIFDPDYGTIDVDLDRLPVFRDSSVRSDRLGVYVQDQIEFLEDFILVAGLRYDTIERTDTKRPDANDPSRSETTRNDDAWTPRVGLIYQPIPELSLYASYSQSFTPGEGTTAAGDPLEPERGEGFEVGVKTELLEGDLLATLAYFDITRQNVATTDPNDPFSSVSTGKQRSRGVELDVIGEILPGWNVIVAYAYIDAEVTEDSDIPEGNRLTNAPEHSASFWTTYEIQRGDLQGLGFGAGFNFIGEREGDLANTFRVDSYFLTNAAIFYRRRNWRFAINVKNLFDIDYIESTDNSRAFGNLPGAPFTILGSVGVEF